MRPDEPRNIMQAVTIYSGASPARTLQKRMAQSCWKKRGRVPLVLAMDAFLGQVPQPVSLTVISVWVGTQRIPTSSRTANPLLGN